MKPHLLFFDIDGTLLSEVTGKISAKTREAVEAARKNGHYTFLNTGRSFAELDPKVVEVGFDGVVCGCGTYVNYRGENLVKETVKGKKAQKILSLIEQCKIIALLEGEEYFYVSQHISDENLELVKKFFGEEVNQKCRYWEEMEPEFQKMSIWLPEDSDFATFRRELEDEFAFIKRSDIFYEVIPKGYSKATGMELLLQHLGIEKKHSVAIGDSTNDLPMLKYAGISVAMGNSAQSVKNEVSFVTKSVEEEGVAYALSHLGFVE